MVARVTIGGQESEPFRLCAGVRQGCVLAPVLFNIYLLCVTKLLHDKLESSGGITVDFRLDGNLFNIQASTNVSVMKVLELQYGDYFVLLAHTPANLQSILVAAVKTYSRVGLSVNTAKTEVICQWKLSSPPTVPVFTIDKQPLTIVPSFKYLGSIVSKDCNLDVEIENQIKQASVAFGRHRRKVFQNKHIQLLTKVTIYKAVCITTLL